MQSQAGRWAQASKAVSCGDEAAVVADVNVDGVDRAGNCDASILAAFSTCVAFVSAGIR